MQNFELTKHQVTEVNFRDNGRQKKGESSFDISGSVLLPKDGKGIIFEQEVHLGKPEENVYLYLYWTRRPSRSYAKAGMNRPAGVKTAHSCGHTSS